MLAVLPQDPQAGQAVAAEVHHGVVRERVHAEQPGVGPVRDQRGPGGRIGQRRRGDLEVLRAVVVQDEQMVPGVLHVVVHALAARRHHAELSRRRGRVQQPHLAGQHAGRLDHQVALAAGQAHVDVEALVRLLEHHGVRLRRGADPVPPDPVRPPGVVHGRVEHGGAVQGPRAAGVGVRDLVRQRGPGGQVLDPEREPLVAREVGGVGQPALVRAGPERAEAEEVVALGELVAVEQYFFPVERLAVCGHRRDDLAGPDRAAAVHRVLLALDRPGVVPPAALAHRDGQVALLRARLDLGEDLLAQRGQVGRDRVGVGVLGLQVADRVGVVFVREPGVLIDHGVAVEGARAGDLLGLRRLDGHEGPV